MIAELSLVKEIAPLLAALAASAVIYLVLQSASLELSGAPGRTARRLERFAGAEREPDLLEKIGLWAIRRAGIDPRGWETRLAWARLGGAYQRTSLAGLAGRSLFAGTTGLVLALMFDGLVFWALPVVLFLFPFVRLRSAASAVEHRVSGALPETATLVAAEMAAGSSPDRALLRASELPGPMGTLLSSALAESRRSGKPLFSRSREVRGSLVESLSRMGSSELLAFATQLDLVATKGAVGADLMDSIARGLAREYRRRAMRAAEQLESRLVVPAAVFFFLPFVVAVMVPLLAPLLAAF